MAKTSPKPKPVAPSAQRATNGGSGGKMPPPAPPVNTLPPEKAKAYWRRNLTIISVLLAIWFLVSYVAAIFLANILFNVPVGQLPMSFWFAQQGAIITFVILIFAYCLIMDRVDKEFDVNE
jgi:putative solute:sodium symporter small subunit